MKRRAFSLMELLTVMAIIAILAALAVPAIKAMGKSNDSSQAKNLVTSLIQSARSIAIAQHRMAGVVFFEETAVYSRPADPTSTAAQIVVENFNQRRVPGPKEPLDFRLADGTFPIDHGVTLFDSAGGRQRLPSGIMLAALNDVGTVNSADNTAGTNYRTRVIVFGANGDLIMYGGMGTTLMLPAGGGVAGSYPQAYGDWNFIGTPGITGTFSSPGFFLYNKSDYATQKFPDDASRSAWLKQHADVLVVNGNTGNVLP